MNKVLTIVFAGAFVCGIALAQDAVARADESTPLEQQTPATTSSGQQQAPEPSTSQPQSQQQLPEPQQSPQTQEPPASQPQPAPETPQVPTSPGRTGASMQAGGTSRIVPGSVIPVQLIKTIDAKKAKTGDEVVAKVTQDLKANSGELIVPKDTKMVGHVTEAQARSKEQKESQVAIAFDHAVMKKGGEMPLPMSIQAIIAPPNNSLGAAGGNDQPGAPAGNAGGTPAGGARTGGMGSTAPRPTPNASESAGAPNSTQAGANPLPPITASTQGVIGISDLKLSAGQNATQGSVVSSEKNNVKLDSGTLMLLRVNQ